MSLLRKCPAVLDVSRLQSQREKAPLCIVRALYWQAEAYPKFRSGGADLLHRSGDRSEMGYQTHLTPLMLLLLVAGVLAACQPVAPLQPAPTETRTAVVESTGEVPPNKTPPASSDQIPTTSPTQHEKSSLLPAGLTVEEYMLQGPPTTEPRSFAPLQGSQADILAMHPLERSTDYGNNSFFDDGHYSMRVNLGADTLIASENYNQAGSDGWVTVTRNGQEIYKVGIGPGSPISALRSLWIYDDHWVLETSDINQHQEGNTIYSDPVGQISQDGELLNDRYGFEEMFGFQLLAGRPFYFFKKDGKIGFSYDGQSVEADYDEIPHYGCCSGGELNPIVATNMVAFFSKRDNVWHYIEIGVYKSASPTQTATPAPRPVPDTTESTPAQIEISLPPTPEHTIFGAEVTDGPFTFDLRLIQDPKFSQAPSMPWMYSDLPGYGSSMMWVYHGSGIQEEGEEFWGVGSNLNVLGGFDQFQEGENGGREGGIVLPNQPKPGDKIDMVLKLVIGDETYGAVLSFTVQEGPNGLEPADISVTGLP